MDENSLETMLESFDNLPDLVFNNLDEADPAKTNQQFITVVRLSLSFTHVHFITLIVVVILNGSCRSPSVIRSYFAALGIGFGDTLSTPRALCLHLFLITAIILHGVSLSSST